MTMLLGSMMVFMAGVILDSVARGRTEQKRVHYLSIAPSRGEKSVGSTARLHERRSKPALQGTITHQDTSRTRAAR